MLGRWVRTEGEGGEARTVAGTPDGRTVTLPWADGRAPGVLLGALRLPGGAEPVAVALHRQIALYAGDDTSSAGELGRVTPMERGGEFAAGTRFVPPVDFWHALRPRDERASAVLRALTDEQAAEVLRAAAEALARRQAKLAAAKVVDGTSESSAVVPPADEAVREVVSASCPRSATAASSRVSPRWCVRCCGSGSRPPRS